jgi:intracellular sulfur oxidation DsrE/DsrF family protein
VKTLNIIETAYRATVEEQDDTVVWVVHAMRGAEADVAVLLRGAAVNYAVRDQDASGLRFGDITQRHPPDLSGDVAKLVQRGVPVYYLSDDLAARGIREDELLSGLLPITRASLPRLFEGFARVWHW